jgi:hypothetical protein
MDFEHRKLVAGEIALPYAREGATRAKAGGGSGGKTNAHDNFAKGLFVQACPASCVRPASCVLRPASCVLRPASCVLRPASCVLRPAYVLRASCVCPACVCDENSHNSV